MQEQNVAALFLDPGLGKTSIVLDAFSRLKAAGMASRMLVVAPLRVCQTVWRQEGQRWTEFRDLRFSLLHGPKKAERLRDDADVWLINPEGVAWLAKQKFGMALPWDTVVIDELTKFKNHGAERHKALRPRLKHVARKWGLTGTPAPNGYMDLFGQMLLLDDGAALDRFVTHFRDAYFQVDFDGFTYNLMPGAEKRIEEKIRPYVLRMSAEDYLELPPITDDVRLLELEPAARSTYARMKKDMLAELPEGVVTGANAAAVYSKLAQMANGAVYMGDDKRTVSPIHNAKLEALDELVEELAGQQLLLAYEFNHDLERLKAHFGPKLAYIGAGASERYVEGIVQAWNRGNLPLLACHPASAAHGLNLQHSSCAHVAWFSPIWDLELYQQFIRRIRRQGNDAQRIVNHLLCVRDTIDELKLEALRDKDVTQERLLRSLNAEITGEKEPTMTVQKLSRQADAGGEQRILPRGWRRPAAPSATQSPDAEATAQQGTVSNIEEQRERIQATLKGTFGAVTDQNSAEREMAITMGDGPTPAEKARAAFSQAIQDHLGGKEPVQPEVIRDHRDAPTEQPATASLATPDVPKATRQRRTPATSTGDLLDQQLKMGILQLATQCYCAKGLSDGPSIGEIANDMMAFIAAA